MRLWPAAFAFAAIAAIVFGACYPLSNVCGHHDETMTADGGGQLGCLRGEDCPRISTDVVCTDDGLDEANCVACVDTGCVRRVAELCK